MAKYYYLICKKGWFGKRKPITICTSSEAAQRCCTNLKGCVIMRQSGEEKLKEYIPETVNK